MTTTFDASSWLDQYLAQQRAARSGATVELAPATDHREAKARALAVLAGGDPLICARDAFDALTARNAALCSRDGVAIRSALADQVAILEAVVSAYTTRAAMERNPEKARTLQAVAIRASTTLTTALLALHRVIEDQANANALPHPHVS